MQTGFDFETYTRTMCEVIGGLNLSFSFFYSGSIGAQHYGGIITESQDSREMIYPLSERLQYDENICQAYPVEVQNTSYIHILCCIVYSCM